MNENEKPKKSTKDKFKDFIRTIINIILVLILLFSGYNIFLKLNEYKKADELYTELRELNVETVENPNAKREDLSYLNEDFRYWITVENTNVDYPVVQSTDNNYYLYTSFDHEYNGSGTVFMDYRNDHTTDDNVILYGHNMRNGTIFHDILQYKEAEFFNQNNRIKIFTNEGIEVYEVFSSYATGVDFDYLLTDFETDEEYKKYIDTIVNKSYNKYDGEVTVDDKLITLSTCSYETDNARTVVHGKLVEVIEYKE